MRTIAFDHTTHRRSLKEVDGFVRDSSRILAEWDAYSEEHTDLDGWPHDDHAYGLRQSRRDAETARAFENIRAHAHHLLATADVQLGTLPKAVVQNRWGYQLGVLRDALDQLNRLSEEWLRTKDTLPGPGTASFNDALAEHHAECWSSLDDWATHAHALRDINSAARHASSPLAPPPTVTAALSAGRATPVRR